MQKNYLSNEKNDISSIRQVGGRMALRLIDPMGHYRESRGPKQRGILVAQKDNNKMGRKLWRRVHIAYPLKKKKEMPQSTPARHRPSHADQVVHAQHARILARHSPLRTLPTTTTARTTTSTRCLELLAFQRDAAAYGTGTRRVRRRPARRVANALDAAQPGVTALRRDPVDRDAPSGAVAPLASGAPPRVNSVKRLGAWAPLRSFDGTSHRSLQLYGGPCVRWS